MFDMTWARRSLGMALFVWGVLQIIYLRCSQKQWDIFVRQFHIPSHVGSLPLDSLLTKDSGLLVKWAGAVVGLVFLSRLLRRHSHMVAEEVGDMCEDAWDSLHHVFHERKTTELTRQWRGNGGPERASYALVEFLSRQDITVDPEVTQRWIRYLEGDGPGQPSIAEKLARGLAQREDDYPHLPNLLAAYLIESGDLPESFQIQDFVFCDEQSFSLSNHLERLFSQGLGASFSLTTVFSSGPRRGYVALFNHPLSAHERERIRLMVAAVNLVTWTRAGESADRLHDDFAAECRLASYHGFIIHGSNDAIDIEKAICSDVQAALHGDLIATTPDMDVAA